MDPNALRRDYEAGPLDLPDLDGSPLVQFQRWLEEAIEARVPFPDAMTLASATPEGAPSARVVLLRGHDDRGLVFYTDYRSGKGQQFEANPRAAAVFYWPEQHRQVRVEGTVARIPRSDSQRYFATRPRESQLAARASMQSAPIPDRATLEAAYEAEERRFEGQPVEIPDQWGGYRLVPNRFEFWQGRPGRLHDRFRYDRADDAWHIERLAP